jgi:hypothetical protein
MALGNGTEGNEVNEGGDSKLAMASSELRDLNLQDGVTRCARHTPQVIVSFVAFRSNQWRIDLNL